MSAELDQTRPVVAALRKIIAEADKYPFNPIGHVVEHVVPDARAALEAALSTLPQLGWRPIESTPTNKAVLLAWRDWRDGKWCMEVGAATTHGSATHWMPLPASLELPEE